MRLDGPALHRLRAELSLRGFTQDFVWSESVTFPETPEDLAAEYAWVLCNSGMKNTVARVIFDRLWPVVTAGGSASETFGHEGKAAAIDLGWRLREQRWAVAQPLSGEELLAWCHSLPWIGKITRWHLAKNLGANVAKPDRWLLRLADTHGETWDGLCARLAAETGWRVATVDLLLWRGCAEGVIVPAPGGVTFATQETKAPPPR